MDMGIGFTIIMIHLTSTKRNNSLSGPMDLGQGLASIIGIVVCSMT